MVRYGQVWSGMVRYGQVWSSMVRYGQVWSSMVRYGQVWSGIAYLAIIIGHGVSHITCRWDLKVEKERGRGGARRVVSGDLNVVLLYYIMYSPLIKHSAHRHS